MFKIEYDDGLPLKRDKDRVKECTPKNREAGYYLIYPNGHEERLPVGYMRINEMKKLQKIFNDVAEY